MAQFSLRLADNALLIAAMALLTTMNEPAWMTPLLKMEFRAFLRLTRRLRCAFADSDAQRQSHVCHQPH